MILDKSGKDFIIANEGIRYKAYIDTNGYATTGVGHLIKNNESYLRTKVLSYEDAMTLFDVDIQTIESYVSDLMHNVQNQNLFNALCDFCFQYGTNLSRKYPQTYKNFLSGDINTICNTLMNFTHANILKQDGLLLGRREKEINLIRKI